MSSSLCLMPFRVLLSPAGHDSSSCEIDPNVRAPTILISLLIIGVGSFVWAIPYPLIRSSKRNVVHVDRKARWGVLVQCVGYSILWQSHFWLARPSTILLIASVFCFAIGDFISWWGAFALGKNFAVDAAAGETGTFVRSGPYRFIRHPIYLSMLFVLVGTGILLCPWYLLCLSVLVCLAGTGFRIKIEDRLLAAHYGRAFDDYKNCVPALIPFFPVRSQ